MVHNILTEENGRITYVFSIHIYLHTEQNEMTESAYECKKDTP